MIDSVMQKIRDEIDRLYRDDRSYRDIAKRVDVSYGTVQNIHQGHTQKPEISTIVALAEGLGLDIHELAHEAFGLGPPDETIEMTDMMKMICSLVEQLGGEERTELAGYIKRMLEEGGGLEGSAEETGFG